MKGEERERRVERERGHEVPWHLIDFLCLFLIPHEAQLPLQDLRLSQHPPGFESDHLQRHAGDMKPCGQGVAPEQKICWVRMEEGVAGKAETQTVLVNEKLIQCHSPNEAVQQGALKPITPSGFSLAFPGGSDGKESACNAGDPGSDPELGRSPGEGNGCPLQYYCLENPVDKGAWQARVHGVSKSLTGLKQLNTHALLSI